MSKTALNVIAIFVFLMTFSSLLGPVLNLSPAVTAITIFAVLGLATVDTTSWQGKGTTLFLDWIAGFSPEHRERVLHHEAGHFLVAYLFDIPIIGYSLSAWEAWKQKQPGQGGVSFNDQKLALQLEQGTVSAQMLDRYCTVWMAGIAAETLVYKNAEGGSDDKSKLATVLTSMGFSPSACEQKQRFFALQAKTLLQKNWSAYQALVSAMRQRASVSECVAALKNFQLQN